MSTEKTTTLSIVVGVAAFLAELIFRNTFSSSTVGVILSVVLALVILCCTYLVVDGLQNSASTARKKEENRKREYDEKLYRLLNKRLSEIVKLQKEAMGENVYRDVEEEGQEVSADNHQDFLTGQVDESILAMLTESEAQADSQPSSVSEQQPAVLSIDNSERDRLLESINENIMKSAKFIVKYNKKNQEQNQELTEKSVEDLLQAVKQVEKEIQSLGEQLSNISLPSSVSEQDRINELFAGGVPTSESILPKENELSDLFITEEPEDSLQESLSQEVENSYDEGLYKESEASQEENSISDELSMLQEDIAADLLSARQEIQSEETRLEDILPADILKELEEISIAEDNSAEKPEETIQPSTESDEILREILEEAEALIAKEAVLEQTKEIEAGAKPVAEMPELTEVSTGELIESSSEAVGILEETLGVSEEIEKISEETIGVSEEIEKISEETVEVLGEIEKISEETAEASEEPEESSEEVVEVPEEPVEALEPPVENLTAVDLLRIKQKEKEEAEAKQEQEKEIFIPEKVEVPAQEDSDGIMSAEDIAALFASNNTES